MMKLEEKYCDIDIIHTLVLYIETRILSLKLLCYTDINSL